MDDILPDFKTVQNITQDMKKNNDIEEKMKFRQSGYNEINDLSTNYLVENNELSQYGIDGILTEITKRKNAEERIRLLSTAIEQTTEGVAVSNMDGDLLFVNNAFANMHGYDSKNVIGKHVSSFQAKDQIQVVKTGEPEKMHVNEYNGEVWHLRSDGTIFPTYTNKKLFRKKIKSQ